MIFFPFAENGKYNMVRREIHEELTETQVKEFTQQAEAGDVEAQLALAYHYCGEAEKKLELFRSIPSGSRNMRGAYCIGDRNPIVDAANEDREIAFGWFEKAAGQGSIQALYELSVCYRCGEGTPPYPEKARELLAQAANAGYMPAQYDYGMLYLYGKTSLSGEKPIPKDEALAVQWLLKAAEQGDCLAQYQLGECFETGMGVEADREKAVAWYEKAAELGNELACQALESLKEE